MKKFLLLMLILGLATSAQAGLIFTVWGEPQPEEIWIYPSEVIEIDLEIGDGQNIFGYGIDYVLTNNQAEFITDGRLEGTLPIQFPAVFELASKITVDEPQQVSITGSQLFGAALEGPQVIMKDLYIHCLEMTDVVLEIYALPGTTVDGQPLEGLVHTLTIHQIPEPMTLTLLGLGGLFLVRRKK
jgi:hypothetical protein